MSLSTFGLYAETAGRVTLLADAPHATTLERHAEQLAGGPVTWWPYPPLSGVRFCMAGDTLLLIDSPFQGGPA